MRIITSKVALGFILAFTLMTTYAHGSTAMPAHDWAIKDSEGWSYGFVEYHYTAPLSSPGDSDSYEWRFQFGERFDYVIPGWLLGVSAATAGTTLLIGLVNIKRRQSQDSQLSPPSTA